MEALKKELQELTAKAKQAEIVHTKLMGAIEVVHSLISKEEKAQQEALAEAKLKEHTEA